MERQEAAAAAVRRKREAEEAARLKLEAERGTLPADLAHADAALSSTKPFCAEHPVKEAPSEPSRTVGFLPPAPERQESLPSVSRFVDAPNSADHHSPTVRFTVTPAREPARDATGGHFLEKTVVASILFLGFPSWPFNDQEPTIRTTDWLEPGQQFL